jgi:hypothetical protein
MKGLRVVVALVLGASALAGCQQELGPTVAGESCLLNLRASPRSVHPGGQVSLRRAPDCDEDHARRLTVSIIRETRGPRPIGTATLDADGAVTGTVVIPAHTRSGRVELLLHEKSGCNDTAACHGHPTSARVRVR